MGGKYSLKNVKHGPDQTRISQFFTQASSSTPDSSTTPSPPLGQRAGSKKSKFSTLAAINPHLLRRISESASKSTSISPSSTSSLASTAGSSSSSRPIDLRGTDDAPLGFKSPSFGLSSLTSHLSVPVATSSSKPGKLNLVPSSLLLSSSLAMSIYGRRILSDKFQPSLLHFGAEPGRLLPPSPEPLPFLHPDPNRVDAAVIPSLGGRGRPRSRIPRSLVGTSPLCQATDEDWKSLRVIFNRTWNRVIVGANASKIIVRAMKKGNFMGDISCQEYVWNFWRQYLNPRLVPLLVRDHPPTAYELWQLGLPHAGPSIGVYLKICFALVQGMLDLVYGGKAGSFANYGFTGRLDEHIVDYEKKFLENMTDVNLSDPHGGFHTTLRTARALKGSVVHSVPQFSALLSVPRQLGEPPSPEQVEHEDAAIHLSELLLVRMLGLLVDRHQRTLCSPWKTTDFPYAPTNVSDQGKEAMTRTPAAFLQQIHDNDLEHFDDQLLAADIRAERQATYLANQEVQRENARARDRRTKEAAEGGDEAAIATRKHKQDYMRAYGPKSNAAEKAKRDKLEAAAANGDDAAKAQLQSRNDLKNSRRREAYAALKAAAESGNAEAVAKRKAISATRSEGYQRNKASITTSRKRKQGEEKAAIEAGDPEAAAKYDAQLKKKSAGKRRRYAANKELRDAGDPVAIAKYKSDLSARNEGAKRQRVELRANAATGDSDAEAEYRSFLDKRNEQAKRKRAERNAATNQNEHDMNDYHDDDDE